MYICPVCGFSFGKEEAIQKHFLACWKERNPNHKSAPAPRSEDINTTQIGDGVLDFFESLKVRK